MASLLNVANCGGSTGTFNSGVPICDVIRDIPYGLIFLDSGVEFDATDMASATAFVAALDAATRAARGSRAYPMWALTNFEDASQEATKIALGNLTNAQIEGVEAIPAFTFQHRKGELFHRQLAKAESQNLKVLIVDKKYVVYGTQTSGGNLTGFSMTEFKAGLAKFGTPAAASFYPFSVTLDSVIEYKENGAFFQADSTITNVSGIVDVTLAELDMTGSVLKVSLTALGGKNLTDLYSTELTQATAWVVKNSAGASVTVSAAFDSTNKVMSLTLSGTPWTGASTGDDFTCTLAPAATLAAAPINIDGYEAANTLSFEKQ